ncbi:MAG TPA: methyltransferase [Ktedonobacterales bacterium]|nr:methyltransferase [Ktedonobacterales bacterium]
MADRDDPDLWALSDLCAPWCLRVAATLRVADHIADGASQIDELARRAEADARSLERVLRYLVGIGIFAEPEPGRFTLNPAAEKLRDGHPSGLRFILDQNGFGSRMDGAWSTLLSAVQTGKPAYAERFGLSFWDDLDAHPGIAASFDALMGPAGHATPSPDIPLTSGWESVRTVVDVGGGTGTLLAEVLRAHPGVHGVLVDLPRTVARSGPTFQAAGVADRVTSASQSFFDPLPAGADLYLLKSVLPDWPDAEAAAILRRCAEAARANPNGRVVLLNGVSPDDAGPAPELLMLVLVGGKDRGLSEFRALALSAGLEVVATTRQPSGRFVVECRPI